MFNHLLINRSGVSACLLAGGVLMALMGGCGSDMSSSGVGGSEPLVTQGPYLSRYEVRSHVLNAGFPSYLADTMVRIAQCESSLGARSYAWAGGNRHTGLFQISDLHKSACGYGGYDKSTWHAKMTAPALNAKCAYVVYRNAGNSLRPWDCFTGRR